MLLQRIRFIPQIKSRSDYHLYVLLTPYLGNRGMDNTALVDDYKGMPMLLAEGNGSALALAYSARWLRRSAGFVGFSDGWQDISRHNLLERQYDRAE